MNRVQILWNNWNKYDDLDSVYRQGFLKIRAYGFGDEAKGLIDQYHVSTTLTHSGRSAMLFSDMMDLYPSYFKSVDKYAALKVMQTHDIGELVVGDVCDDGRAEHEDKKPSEWEAVVKHYNQLPEEMYLKCKCVHQDFEECKTFLGQSLKMADKLDFLAKLIKLEGQGYMLDNKEYYSENDIALAEEIGSYKFIDIVGNHFRHLVIEYAFSQKLIDIATGFIACGLDSIQQPFYPWWNLNLPEEL